MRPPRALPTAHFERNDVTIIYETVHYLVLIVALPSSLALNSDMKPAEVEKLTTELGHDLQYFGAKVQEKQPPQNEDAEKIGKAGADRG